MSPELPLRAVKLAHRFGPWAELRRHLSTVDEQSRARNERRGVRCQEHDCGRDLGGIPAPAERNLAEVLLQNRRVAEMSGSDARPYQSGTDCVYANPVRAQLIRGGMKEAEHAGFRCIVGRQIA